MLKRMLNIITAPTVINVVLPVGLTVILFIGAVFLLTLPAIENSLIAEKRETIKELTNLTWDLLNDFENKVQRGELSRDQAKQLACETINHFRYGAEKKDYFWINDMHPRMVMHPYRPDLNGSDLTGFTDPEGNHLFVDFVKAVKTDGQGYVRYMWQWKDNPDHIVPKLSFVKEFKPWGWIIGTGIYLEEVRERIDQLSKNLKTLFSLILFFIILLSFYTIWKARQSEQKKALAEKALRTSEERYRTILKIFEDGYFEVDLTGNMVFCNDAMSKLIGYPKEQLMEMNNRSYMDPETADQVYHTFKEVYRTGKPHKSLDWKLSRPDGTNRWIETSVTLIRDSENQPAGFRGIVRDISERKSTEETIRQTKNQLRHSRKMESIGTLTGGIAHDFNNILSIILGNTEIALADLSEWNPARRNLTEIRNATLRAKDVIQQLLSFSRKTDHLLRPVRIDMIVDDTLKLLRASIPSNITIQKTVTDPIGIIMADPTQIHQIILNLCTNAFHAMENIKGRMDIELSNTFVGESELKNCPGLCAGNYVLLEIRDNGDGIEEGIMEKIFDPYFTTKEIGKGTGMGLSVVHGIVKNHGGTIQVDSRIHEGSSFRILFPAVNIEYKKEEESFPAEIPKGNEKILFVDDEELIAQITQKQLERLGYDVVAETDPLSALDRFRSDPDLFDLIITDMTMPQMSGEKLVQEITKIKPDMPIIICTGYNDKITEAVSHKIGARGLLMKPFGISELAVMIKNVINPP